jgi:NAD(P)-dependent dehydrogenase (short-subunit alcohol dehydrogenase family)
MSSSPTPSRPTAVVTGGSAGLGLAVAHQLTGTHRLVLLARDTERGARARDAVGGDTALVVGDLGSVATTTRAGEALLEACPRLDVLVHNAGIWPSRRTLTEDGLEQAFVTNHLAPFLLSSLLDDRLRDSAARVVQVSAGIYTKGRVDLDRTPVGADFSGLRTYADTKLCNLALLPLWARHWAGSGVTVNAVHPGVVRTGLGDRPGAVGLLLRLAKRRWESPEDGARPVARLAVDEQWHGRTGRYVEVDREVEPVGAAADLGLARALWEQAARLTGATLSA